jgi:hypothetical protein
MGCGRTGGYQSLIPSSLFHLPRATGRDFASNACLKNNEAFKFSEGVMGQRFSFLLRAGKKLIEVAAAGCASAVVAFLLGNSHEPAPPTAATSASAPAVVRLAPADEEMMRAVRQESATLVAHLRSGPQPATASTTAVAAPANGTTAAGAAAISTPARQGKTIPAPPPTSPRKEAKVSRPPAGEIKVRTVEPTPSLAVPPPAPPVRAQTTATLETSEPRLAQASGVGAESDQALGIRPISKWFSDVPRPPVGIGEDASRSM